jgi:hypothetical protein
VERGVFERVGVALLRQWGRFGRRLTSHFGTEVPQPTPPQGDYLGVPRLPRAVEVEEPVVPEIPRAREPLGVPVPDVRDTSAVDSLRLRPDTLRDTVRVDTMRVDTIRR